MDNITVNTCKEKYRKVTFINKLAESAAKCCVSAAEDGSTHMQCTDIMLQVSTMVEFLRAMEDRGFQTFTNTSSGQDGFMRGNISISGWSEAAKTLTTAKRISYAKYSNGVVEMLKTQNKEKGIE